jgi:hypothetical protein
MDKQRTPAVIPLAGHQVEQRSLGAAEARAIGKVEHRS